MNVHFQQSMSYLQKAGWIVIQSKNKTVKPDIKLKVRYGWLPHEINLLLNEYSKIVNEREDVWINTTEQVLVSDESGFLWNQWEIESYLAFSNMPSKIESTRAFWDMHYPIAMSVGGSYSYLAIESSHFSLVRGDGPDFEETRVIADSYIEFLCNFGEHLLEFSRT